MYMYILHIWDLYFMHAFLLPFIINDYHIDKSKYVFFILASPNTIHNLITVVTTPNFRIK